MNKKNELQRLIQRRNELNQEITKINAKIIETRYGEDATFLKRKFDDCIEFIKKINKNKYLSVSDEGIFERNIYDLSDYDIINEEEYHDYFDKVVKILKKI